MKNFKEKLDRAVKSAGIQDKDLVGILGMSKEGFSVMKKNGTIRADALKKISDALNVPVSYFFEDGDDTEIEFKSNTSEAKAMYFDPNYVKLLERQVQEKDSQIQNLMEIIKERRTA